MNYETLITKVMSLAPFSNADDARLALISSLETLGFLLPERLVQALASELPHECAAALSLGLSVGQRHPRVRGDKAQALPLSGQTLERVQEICSALGKLLAAELVASLVAELPAELASAFDGGAAHTAPALIAGHPHPDKDRQ
jgi:uncharacterized protein (DUF2267 family)